MGEVLEYALKIANMARKLEGKKEIEVIKALEEAEEKLSVVFGELEYFSRPVSREGYLQQMPNLRYTIRGTDIEFSSGAPLEYWDANWEMWRRSRMEHNGDFYYIVGLGYDVPIDGEKVRIRQLY